MTSREDWMLRKTAPYMRADEKILWMGSFQKGGGRKADRRIKKEGIQAIFSLIDILLLFLFWKIIYDSFKNLQTGIWIGILIALFMAGIFIFQCVICCFNVSASKNWYMITERQVLIWLNKNGRMIADQLTDLTDVSMIMGRNHIGRIDYKVGGETAFDEVDYNLMGQKMWTKWSIYVLKCNFHNLCGVENPEEVAAILNRAIREAKRKSNDYFY